MKFLVTGGAGFIGSHLTEKLLKEGHFVRVLDNFSSGKQSNIDAATNGIKSSQFEVLKGDIQDAATCDKACAGMDYVLHQAALRSVPKSMTDPLSYNHVNIDGTFFLLQAALKNKIKRFVFASSSSVYGDTEKFPEREDALPLLISPYALSKLANEYYCRIFTNAWGLETVGLRYFNVFGPRQALDDEYAVVIPKFIHCILHDQQPPIFGTGKQSRDFTFVDNVVEANILAATTPGIKHEVFNVANGRDNTVLQLVEALNKIIGKKIEPKLLPVRVGDVFKTLADISKIKSKLGYQGKVNFEEGLRRTVEYFRGVYKK
ncbi:MAG TPA: SDR family oxidoreductase [Candidatus Omnitrophota bacterium]|nr:SDR family oxidoreductase [Candidatus Omnitrophota bacterium]